MNYMITSKVNIAKKVDVKNTPTIHLQMNGVGFAALFKLI